MQQLTCRQELQTGLPESEARPESLEEEFPYVRIPKDNSLIKNICKRARALLKSIDDTEASADQTLDMIKEMHELDQTAITWRQGSCWAYETIRRSQLGQDELATSKFPEFIQLHPDIWIAYEWNYHRTTRIVLHEHLLECLDRLQILYSGSKGTFPTDLHSMRQASLNTIRALVDEVLSLSLNPLEISTMKAKLSSILQSHPNREVSDGTFSSG
ncbi:hypothetical protein ABVK25_007416 [Lepraria finkii]|uniref:Uncharacterized protein n=1 Tax=Lepraria finkii TaxID=1340010 RepID=A0ABR4B2X8_9LECA